MVVQLRLIVPEVNLTGTTVHVQVNDRLCLRLVVRESWKRWMRLGRGGDATTSQHCHRDTAETKARAAEKLPARLRLCEFNSWIHDRPQFRVSVSSRFKSMLATSVYAANSAGASPARGFDSPCAIAF